MSRLVSNVKSVSVKNAKCVLSRTASKGNEVLSTSTYSRKEPCWKFIQVRMLGNEVIGFVCSLCSVDPRLSRIPSPLDDIGVVKLRFPYFANASAWS